MTEPQGIEYVQDPLPGMEEEDWCVICGGDGWDPLDGTPCPRADL